MKQIASVLSTYTADVSGVCSALFELGGMTVMHDASGCNSTYHTHDEPRWYDMDSMVYISAVSEMEAIMGDDNKLINDIVAAATDLSPRFIAIAGTPIPLMMGTDFKAIANIIEQKTNIPTFGFPTNSMHSYLAGASMAWAAFAERLCLRDVEKNNKSKPSLNILGATPLDFSVNGSVEAMRRLLQDSGYEVVSCWAMGSGYDDLVQAGRADVNLVVSYAGLAVAEVLQRLFATPYVVGVPIGQKLTDQICADLKAVAADGANRVAYANRPQGQKKGLYIIGENVTSSSLAYALATERNFDTRVLCPLETQPQLLSDADQILPEEEDLRAALADAALVVADPIYRRICTEKTTFIPLAHEAYSGRIYRKDIPVLIGQSFAGWQENSL
jgi:nitrogenase molybdenum-cofactor synthesis protein NifE